MFPVQLWMMMVKTSLLALDVAKSAKKQSHIQSYILLIASAHANSKMNAYQQGQKKGNGSNGKECNYQRYGDQQSKLKQKKRQVRCTKIEIPFFSPRVGTGDTPLKLAREVMASINLKSWMKKILIRHVKQADFIGPNSPDLN